MAAYQPTIGLEIHAELKTQTKMFCRSKNDPFASEANVHICPVCMAHPGTLPVINGEAIRHVLKVGLALGSSLADYTEFDRKNYFYPDLPKGYQLSQYEYPLVSGGRLRDVEITRIHLEEDTASSIHDEATGTTVIDYNRAGVPLMELVTEPVITSSKQAGDFARELQLLLRYLGVSGANMEKGEMRVEANVSVRRADSPTGELGTKVEIKNLNSFRAMERAVEYELKRQEELLERGESVVQETRGWDEGKQVTFPQRVKEGSADYRYFPDPDLPSLKLSEIDAYAASNLRQDMPELPWERRSRYLSLGINVEDAEAYIRDTVLGDFFDAVSEGTDAESARLASNYISNDLVNLIRDTDARDTETKAEMPVSVDNFKKIMDMIRAKKISSRAAKDLLAMTAADGSDPEALASAHDLIQKDDIKQLEDVVETVLEQNPGVVSDFKAGKAAALEFLLGQCMKALRGAGDPNVLRQLLQSKMT
ncbi:Asp-tRNA(Asn)/Glu-tRNA(Gln) amidotransferase subunit GatB [Candidatus Kaiserbacteria bacterium]|nr:Asp-tRNA(Asn)/Glu-tRNA(Gln) amidotransferase subunit GatB [Candidatus Kaiserbacteria bacterium]